MEKIDLTYGGFIPCLKNVVHKRDLEVRFTIDGKTGMVTTLSFLIDPKKMEMITIDYQDLKKLVEGKNDRQSITK